MNHKMLTNDKVLICENSSLTLGTLLFSFLFIIIMVCVWTQDTVLTCENSYPTTHVKTSKEKRVVRILKSRFATELTK